MKKTFARILSFVLCTVMIMSMVPTVAIGAGGATSQTQVWLYVPSDGTTDYADILQATTAQWGGQQPDEHYNDAYEYWVDFGEATGSTDAKGDNYFVTHYGAGATSTYPGYSANGLTGEVGAFRTVGEDFEFYGWTKLDANGNGEDKAYGAALNIPTGVTIYVAKYVSMPREYDLKFYLPGNVEIPEFGDKIVYGHPFLGLKPTDAEIDTYVDILPGHDFTFWSKDPWTLGTVTDASTDFYAASLEDRMAGDVFLYAHYAPKTADVTYINQYPDGTGSTVTNSVVYGQELQYNGAYAGDLTFNGYTFKGWNEVADGTGKYWTATDKVDFTEDKTLYAVWTANTDQDYKVVLNYEDDHGHMVSGGDFILYHDGAVDQEIVLTAAQIEAVKNLLAQYGYDPAGFSLKEYEEGKKVIGNGLAGAPATVNVYFSRNKYNLTVYSADGGVMTENGVVDADNIAVKEVYYHTTITSVGNRLFFEATDGVVYTYEVTETGYEYKWAAPAFMPVADAEAVATKNAIDVPFSIETLLQDLVIINTQGVSFTLTQTDLETLDTQYEHAYYDAASALGVTVDQLYEGGRTDEETLLFAAEVARQLALVDKGYDGVAASIELGGYTTHGAPITALNGQPLMAKVGSTIKVLVGNYTVGATTTPQYILEYTLCDGTVVTYSSLVDGNDGLLQMSKTEVGFQAHGAFEVPVAVDGSTVVELKYDRSEFSFRPAIWFADGANIAECYEGIPGMKSVPVYYGSPLMALDEIVIAEAQSVIGIGHVGYDLVKYEDIYDLHRRNYEISGLTDFTWPAKSMGLIVGEYAKNNYTVDLYVHYELSDGTHNTNMTSGLFATLRVPFGTVLSEDYLVDALAQLNVNGYTARPVGDSNRWSAVAFDQYLDINSVIIDSTVVANNGLSLYLHVTPKSVDLLFDKAASGANDPSFDTLTVYYNEAIGSVPTVSYVGYIFDGWSFVDVNGNKVVVDETYVVDDLLLGAPTNAFDSVTVSAAWLAGATDVQLVYRVEALNNPGTMIELGRFTFASTTNNSLDEAWADALLKLNNATVMADLRAATLTMPYYAEKDVFEADNAANVLLYDIRGLARKDIAFATGDIVANDGTSVIYVDYTRLTYTIGLIANGVAPSSIWYGFGATPASYDDPTGTQVLKFTYGEDMSNYAAGLDGYFTAVGYAIDHWSTFTWADVLDNANADLHVAADKKLAFPYWTAPNQKLIYVDPRVGEVALYVNGELYTTVAYEQMTVTLPVGATVEAVAQNPFDMSASNSEFVFLYWMSNSRAICYEPTYTFVVGKYDLDIKAVYTLVPDGADYNHFKVYVSSLDNQVLSNGTVAFEDMDDATRDAFVAEANSKLIFVDGVAYNTFDPANGFSVVKVIYDSNGMPVGKIYSTNVEQPTYAVTFRGTTENVSYYEFPVVAAVEGGAPFYCWKDVTNDIVLSYDLEGGFAPTCDVTIEAVYSTEAQTPVTGLNVIRYNDSGLQYVNMNVYTAQVNGYTLIESKVSFALDAAGDAVATDAVLGDVLTVRREYDLDLTKDMNTVQVIISSQTNIPKYFYAQVRMVYMDDNGVQHTEYSNIVVAAYAA